MIYTCPMHPEIRQQRPGNCPKCGMTLEPVIQTVTQTKTEYVCPMHPEVMRRIAAPMVGGMVSSTFLTLIVIPAVYFLWKKHVITASRL